MDFVLRRNVDGFDTKLDPTFTLDMLLAKLEYRDDRAGFEIKLVTGDEEKYEIEPNDNLGSVTEMMDKVACRMDANDSIDGTCV